MLLQDKFDLHYNALPYLDIFSHSNYRLGIKHKIWCFLPCMPTWRWRRLWFLKVFPQSLHFTFKVFKIEQEWLFRVFAELNFFSQNEHWTGFASSSFMLTSNTANSTIGDVPGLSKAKNTSVTCYWRIAYY